MQSQLLQKEERFISIKLVDLVRLIDELYVTKI